MPGNPLTDPNWAADVADLVEDKVQRFRHMTTDKVVMLTRSLVFGLLGLILGIALAVLALIAVTRGLQALLGLGVSHETSVWASYLIMGGLLSLIGALLMRKRHRPDS